MKGEETESYANLWESCGEKETKSFKLLFPHLTPGHNFPLLRFLVKTQSKKKQQND